MTFLLNLTHTTGHKEILGLWIEQTEGAKFWLRVMTELRNRGTQDVLIAVVDGLKGFPEAITSVFPRTVVQTFELRDGVLMAFANLRTIKIPVRR